MDLSVIVKLPEMHIPPWYWFRQWDDVTLSKPQSTEEMRVAAW